MSSNLHTPAVHEHADDWHRHSKAEGMPQAEHAGVVNVNLLFIWMVGISVFVVVSVIGTLMYFNSYSNQLRASAVETTSSAKAFKSAQFNAEKELGQRGQAGEYAWMDHDRVRIPIDAAMKRVVASYAPKDTK